MRNFYEVCIKNKLEYEDYNGTLQKTQTAIEIEKVTGVKCYNCSSLEIKGIRFEDRVEKKEGFLGFQYNRFYTADIPITVICEDKVGFLEEIVTGKKYSKKDDLRYPNYYDEIKLSIKNENHPIPMNKVVEFLKSLSDDEIKRYVKKLNDLDKAVAIGYEKDMQILANDRLKKDNDELYFDNFRKKMEKTINKH